MVLQTHFCKIFHNFFSLIFFAGSIELWSKIQSPKKIEKHSINISGHFYFTFLFIKDFGHLWTTFWTKSQIGCLLRPFLVLVGHQNRVATIPKSRQIFHGHHVRPIDFCVFQRLRERKTQETQANGQENHDEELHGAVHCA